MKTRKKIGLIGAGNIGGELARLAAAKELGDIWLFDVPSRRKFAEGKALDLMQDGAVSGFDATIRGTSNWTDLMGADVLIITAGVPRKAGQSRDDLVAVNLPIIRDVAAQARAHCPGAFVIIVSNPLDVMVYEFQRASGWDARRVVGMAGVLDSARFQMFVAEAAAVSVKDVRAMVLGGHGDDMVPVLSACTINGVAASQLIAADKLAAIVQRTRQGGGEIVTLMGTSAYYAPAAAAIAMAEAHLKDQKRLLAGATLLAGEYGLRDLFLGVPIVIGAGGVEKVLELPLSPDEKAQLLRSASSVKQTIELVNKLGTKA